MSASLMLLGAIAATSQAPTLPHLKRRRRSHEPSSLSVVNIVPSGTPRDRRQRIFKEWLALGHSPGKGTAGFFAHKINAYVATHPDAADGDLHFERGSMGNFLAAADKTRVSRHKVGAKAPAPAPGAGGGRLGVIIIIIWAGGGRHDGRQGRDGRAGERAAV